MNSQMASVTVTYRLGSNSRFTIVLENNSSRDVGPEIVFSQISQDALSLPPKKIFLIIKHQIRKICIFILA